jgi:ADP-ribosylglycohydrolase
MSESKKLLRYLIKMAISFGNDTDTTACIAGGLAGITYGLEIFLIHGYLS